MENLEAQQGAGKQACRYPHGNVRISISHSWDATARAQLQGSSLDLKKGWADYTEIQHTARDQLEMCGQVSWKHLTQFRQCRTHLLARPFVAPKRHPVVFFIGLVRMFLIGGFSISEMTLSGACRASPDLYRTIRKVEDQRHYLQ